MTVFSAPQVGCILCLIFLHCTQGRAAEEKLNAEDQLLSAIAKGDLAEVERIAAGLDLSKVTNLYFHALSSPNADVVDFLREQEGLDISDLQILAIRGDDKAIKQFIESSDKMARRNELRRGHMGLWSYTPLMLALRNGRPTAARALIEAGAEVNEESLKHLTPLAVAAEGGHMEVVKDLLKAGARINADPDDYTALMRACIGDHPKVAEFLLESGADLNLKRHDGQTALHFAAKNGSTECIKLLLDRGFNLNAVMDQEYSPLRYAEIYKHKAAIALLRQAMATSPKTAISPKK